MAALSPSIFDRSPVYIIAELGVNHDGDPARALELTRAAAGAGADAIKLQLFEADRLMSRAAKLAAYQKAAGEQDPLAMLRRLEMPLTAMEPVVALAHDLGMHAIVTVFSVELVAESTRLAWDAYKSASPDVVNRPLLEAMAGTGRGLIVSTGAATLEEVARAAEWLRSWNERLAWLQCVSCYPTASADAAIGAMEDLRRVCPGPVGYSDHTREVDSGAVAVACGARILEKHLTYDRKAAGPDHAASLEPRDFAEYVSLARNAKAGWALAGDERVGSGKKVVQACERDVRLVSRQSVVAAREIAAGRVIGRGDLTIKRPGTGIGAAELERMVGARAVRRIEADMPLMPEDIGGGA